jgi:hypothetical protein
MTVPAEAGWPAVDAKLDSRAPNCASRAVSSIPLARPVPRNPQFGLLFARTAEAVKNQCHT